MSTSTGNNHAQMLNINTVNVDEYQEMFQIFVSQLVSTGDVSVQLLADWATLCQSRSWGGWREGGRKVLRPSCAEIGLNLPGLPCLGLSSWVSFHVQCWDKSRYIINKNNPTFVLFNLTWHFVELFTIRNLRTAPISLQNICTKYSRRSCWQISMFDLPLSHYLP